MGLRKGLTKIIKSILIGAIAFNANGCATFEGFESHQWNSLGEERNEWSLLDGYKTEESRARALSDLCTADGGLKLGQSGTRYVNACSGPRELEFLQAYNVGYQAFLLQDQERRQRQIEIQRESQLEYNQMVSTLDRLAAASAEDHRANKDQVSPADVALIVIGAVYLVQFVIWVAQGISSWAGEELSAGSGDRALAESEGSVHPQVAGRDLHSRNL